MTDETKPDSEMHGTGIGYTVEYRPLMSRHDDDWQTLPWHADATSTPRAIVVPPNHTLAMAGLLPLPVAMALAWRAVAENGHAFRIRVIAHKLKFDWATSRIEQPEWIHNPWQ